MRTSDILILLGLTIQIVAGFILSVEVIGLDRIARWTNSLTYFKSEVVAGTPDKPFYSIGSQSARITSAIGGGSGVLLWKILGDKFFGDVARLSWYSKLLFGVVSAALGAFVGVGLNYLLIYTVSAAVAGLRGLEKRTRAHASGVLGFLLLFIGFVLQFGGTLWQSIAR